MMMIAKVAEAHQWVVGLIALERFGEGDIGLILGHNQYTKYASIQQWIFLSEINMCLNDLSS